MRRTVLAMVVAAASIGGAVVAQASASPAAANRRPSTQRGCATAGTRTVAANQRVRVYEELRDPRRIGYWACRYGRPGARAIGIDQSEGGVPPEQRLAGWFVAFDKVDCARDAGCNAELRVTDLRTGRTRSAPAAGPPLTAGRVSALVLTTRGTTAWTRGTPQSLTTADVWVWERPAPPRVLETIPVAEAGSLAWGGGSLYWTSGGVARSAVLR